MGRQTHIHLLLICFLLATSGYNYYINAQAIESVHFKLNPAQPNSGSGSGTRYVLPTRANRRNRIDKAPSGPNPAGNHLPPSKQ